MSNKTLKYIRLQSEQALPDIGQFRPFKAIVIVEDEVSQIWQWEVCRWLVQSGCACLMAWGQGCDSWREAVEDANLEAFNYDEIPPEHVVVTTDHEDEELSEVFWFSKHKAHHPEHDMHTTVMLHISAEDKKSDLESMYEEA